MNLEYQQSVTLTGYEQYTQGIIIIQRFTQGDRMKKALWHGSIGILVSAAMIAIPLLHFILVPFGLLITCFLITSALNAKEKIIGGQGICPYCNHNIQFVGRSLKFPYLERCTECSRESTVRPRL